MTISVANTANTNTVKYLRTRVNEIADALSTKVITVDSNTTDGNATVNGTFTATVVNATSVTANSVAVGSNVSVTLTGLAVSNSTIAVYVNTSGVSVGANVVANSTTVRVGANVVANSTVLRVGISDSYGEVARGYITVGNSTVNATVNATTVSVGSSVINSTSLAVGSNLSYNGITLSAVGIAINASSVSVNTATVGNSTVNAAVNSSTFYVQNSTASATYGLSSIIGNSTVNSSFSSTTMQFQNSTVVSSFGPSTYTGNSVSNTTFSQTGVTVQNSISSASIGASRVAVGNSTSNTEVGDRYIKIAAVAGDLSSPANGSIWYNSSISRFRLYESGATINVASSGAVGRHTMAFPAAATRSRTVNGASFSVMLNTTNEVHMLVYEFVNNAPEFVQFSVPMNKAWNTANVSAQFGWSHPTTATNFTVQWGIQALALSDGDAIDSSFGTAVTVSDTGGTSNTLYVTAETANVVIAGSPAVSDTVVFQVYRDTANTTDTLDVNARLHWIKIYYTTSAGTDD